MFIQEKYNSILSQFQSVSLDQLDELTLMNRVDKKYVFPAQHLPEFFEKAKKHYKILEISEIRALGYNTQYFDTNDFSLYNMHHNGRLNRQKVRYRTYEVSDTTFLEIKTKNNKGTTIKKRIKTNSREIKTDKEKSFLQKTLVNRGFDLQPSLSNSFYRVMLLSFETKERISVDYNLSFNLNNKKINLPHVAIVEVKREKTNINSPIVSLLKDFRVYSRGFSKYCMGIALLKDDIRKNTFKPNILHLKKLEYEYDIA